MKNSLKSSSPLGFTLLEVILALVIGLSMCTLLVQIGQILEQGPQTVEMVDRQYDVLREAESMISEYREELEEDNLDLSTLLDTWSSDNGVAVSSETVTVSAADESYTFSNVRRITLSKDGQSVSIYLTQ